MEENEKALTRSVTSSSSVSPLSCFRAVWKASRHRRPQHVEHVAVHRVATARPQVGARRLPRLQTESTPEGRRRVQSDRRPNRGSLANGKMRASRGGLGREEETKVRPQSPCLFMHTSVTPSFFCIDGQVDLQCTAGRKSSLADATSSIRNYYSTSTC